MRILLEFRGDKLHQFLFDDIDVLAGRDAGAVRYAEDVCIDCDGRFAKCGIQDDVGCLAADARQRFQCRARARHFAAMFGEQYPAGFYDVPGLGAIQTYRLYVGHQALDAQRIDFARRAGMWI